MIFRQGDILIVPFPFSNLHSIKRRPVVVLSKKFNGNDLIVCGVTSNLKERKCSVLMDNDCLIEGILPMKSLIKVDKLFTLDKSIVIKKVGRLNAQCFGKVRKEFVGLV